MHNVNIRQTLLIKCGVQFSQGSILGPLLFMLYLLIESIRSANLLNLLNQTLKANSTTFENGHKYSITRYEHNLKVIYSYTYNSY